MTDQEINLVIAEELGGWWAWAPAAENPHRFLIEHNFTISHPAIFVPWPGTPDIPIGWELMELTDYCNDLNEMHEVESKLSFSQAPDYNRQLFQLPIVWPWFAHARQRAEAWIKTICPAKWKD